MSIGVQIEMDFQENAQRCQLGTTFIFVLYEMEKQIPQRAFVGPLLQGFYKIDHLAAGLIDQRGDLWD